MAETAEAEAPATKGKGKFTDAQITEIRKLRNTTDEDGKIIHTHASLAKQFDTMPGTISQIVRNRTYKDPNYKPVVDKV